MDDKKAPLVVGGIVLGAIAIAAVMQGRANSDNVVFSAPNPASVASVENAHIAEIQNSTDAAYKKASVASSTILGLAGLQQALLLGQITSDAATKQTEISVAGASQVAQTQSDATVKAAALLGDAQTKIAQIGANEAQIVANNQTTQVQAAAGAQKTSSFWNGIFNFVGALFGKK